MNKLPLLISVPHAGLRIPPEIKKICILKQEDIIADSDEGARDIYDIQDYVAAFITTDIPRAIVDVNRSADDRGDDGVVKALTIWNRPVYRSPLDEKIIALLISKYYEPYHQQLTVLSKRDVILGIDCHTMVAEAPSISSDAGKLRPDICLSNGEWTCPDDLFARMRSCIENAFQRHVYVNDPFRGGFISRSHAKELPWIQIEMARRDFMTVDEKRKCLLEAFKEFCLKPDHN